MKYLVISDIHGSSKYLKEVLDKVSFDKLIILGDVLYHGPRNNLPSEYNPKEVIEILNNLKDKIICVRGNCDADVDLMVLDFEIRNFIWLKVDNTLLYLTHGDKHNKDNIPCRRRKYYIVHGHTHINEFCEVSEKVKVINVGSLSLPKDKYHTYSLIENNTFTSYDLTDGNAVFSIALS